MRRVVFLGGGGGWSPLELPSLELWLDRDRVSGVADGGAVGSWPDGSGKGRNASASGAARPTWRAAGSRNAAGAIEADGASHWMSVAHAAGLDAAGAYSVGFNWKSAQGGNRVALEKGANAKLVFQPDTNQVFYLHGSLVVGSAVRDETQDGTWRTVLLVYDGSSGFYFLDNAQRGSGAAAAPAGNGDPLTLWARDGGGVPCAGWMTDLVVCSAALNGGQRADLHSWLLSR